ncbi:MAG TPA: zinc ABC transporter substrate-binding protein, partial [Verrucomicrobiae bacterium]|nr:zinc ABC transporter substrate-binding protein [Verrucomicrobiae bacterium]
MKKSLLFIGMFIFIMLLSACGKDQAAVPAQTDSTLVVATSISPLADLIKNVGGDKVKVTMLVRPGGDPHSFELTPEAIKSVAQAKVFFA